MNQDDLRTLWSQEEMITVTCLDITIILRRLVSIIVQQLNREDVQCPELDDLQPAGLLSPLLPPGDSPKGYLEDGLLPGEVSGRGQ